jgi:hypothetical protein
MLNGAIVLDTGVSMDGSGLPDISQNPDLHTLSWPEPNVR